LPHLKWSSFFQKDNLEKHHLISPNPLILGWFLEFAKYERTGPNCLFLNDLENKNPDVANYYLE
jgi:hypothetical protein